MHNEYECFKWLCNFLSPYTLDVNHKEILNFDYNIWTKIIREADAQLLIPKLYIELNRKNLLNHLPDQIHEVIKLVHEFNEDRNNRLLIQLTDLIKSLNTIGISPVIIKGAETLIEKSLHSHGRMMNDIDIWILERNRWEDVQNIFTKLKYECSINILEFDQELEHHFPPFFNDELPARIELHHRLIRPSLKHLISEDNIKNRLIKRNTDNGNYMILSSIDQIALSYIQSTHMSVPNFFTGMVPAMKWMDFLERVYLIESLQGSSNRVDFDIININESVDNQFFTALQYYFQYPYSGKNDHNYIYEKEKKYLKSRISILIDIFEKIKKNKLKSFFKSPYVYFKYIKAVLNPKSFFWK